MYLEYFDLKEQPFQLTPDPEFLFLSKAHARAKAYMEYTIWNRDSFVVITGEIGSGKTTLIQHLLGDLDEDVIVAKIHQTQLNELEFYQVILLEFGFKPFNASKVELQDMLNSFLLEQYEMDRQVVLIIDEAQNLSHRVLEEVRLMTGLETDKGKILNLILVGQPELKQTLDAPGMEQLNQRIRFRFHLRALDQSEVKQYIDHRLKVAGRDDQTLFPESTIPIILRYTGGIPRLINGLCDTILILAFVDGLSTVSEELVEEAIMELDWVPYSERKKNQATPISEALQGIADQVPVLRIYDDESQFEEISLDKESMSLGRLPGNDIVIQDKTISGHHAKIINVHGSSIIEDLDSTNGTYVNSERITKRLLRNGDTIQLARVRIIYVDGLATAGNSADTQIISFSDEKSVVQSKKSEKVKKQQ